VELPLIPEGGYRVRALMSGKPLGSFDRAAWTRGVEVPFSGPVEVLELKRV
jgi:hypothetical protein